MATNDAAFDVAVTMLLVQWAPVIGPAWPAIEGSKDPFLVKFRDQFTRALDRALVERDLEHVALALDGIAELARQLRSGPRRRRHGGRRQGKRR